MTPMTHGSKLAHLLSCGWTVCDIQIQSSSWAETMSVTNASFPLTGCQSRLIGTAKPICCSMFEVGDRPFLACTGRL